LLRGTKGKALAFPLMMFFLTSFLNIRPEALAFLKEKKERILDLSLMLASYSNFLLSRTAKPQN
jgi:hypothetical protein